MADRQVRIHGGQPIPTRRWRGIVWVVVVWGRVVLGLLLSGTGGMAFGHAWTSGSAPMWWVGGITLCVGLLLVLSGIYARTHTPQAPAKLVLPAEPAEAQEPLVPLLGAILVYKYQYMTQKQLQQALAEQMSTQPRRRLGEIVVLKGFISASQLEEALNFQHSLAAQLEMA